MNKILVETTTLENLTSDDMSTLAQGLKSLLENSQSATLRIKANNLLAILKS